MKNFVVAAVVVFCLLVLSQSTKAEVIWTSGFESGDFSEWTIASGSWGLTNSSAGAHSGSYRASIDGATSPNGDVLLLANSTAGYEDLQWSYWWKTTAALEAEDYVFAEWSANDGVDWQFLADYTKLANSDWQYASFDLPESADNNPLCQFRFRAVLGSSSDCMSFDDVSLSTAVPEPHFLFLFLPILLCAFRRCKTK
jgi:hypothetical protein